MSIGDQIKDMKFGQLKPPISQVTKDLNELYQMRRIVQDEIQLKERLLATLNRSIEIFEVKKALEK